MRSIIYVFIIAFVCFGIFSQCKNTGTGPDNNNNTKSPSDMKWKCDTLMYPGSWQTMLISLYASSAKDVWAAGFCTDNVAQLWHYKDSVWSLYNIFNDISRCSFGINKLLGFNANNIWLAGDIETDRYKSLILNYQGNKWINMAPYQKNRAISICTKSENDIYIGSDNGIIMRYYYGNWKIDTIKINLPPTTDYLIKDIVVYNGKVFAMANLNDPTLDYIKTYYFMGEMGNWVKVDSLVINETQYYLHGGDLGFYLSNTGRLYSYGDNGIWEWRNNTWNEVLVSNSIEIAGMYGISDDYIYAVGAPSFFYNGSRWTRLTQLESLTGENLFYRDVWTDGKEVFITGYNTGGIPNKTHLWHGK